MGKPCAHFGLGMGSRVHTLALAWAAVCTLWPWHGQPCAHFGLGIGKPWAHFGLGMGKPCAHFGLGMGSRVHTLALARADFGLGRATLASEKKKEKVSRNLLKFCMEAYKPILSTSAKNGRKIRKNEAFSLVLRFRPWPCAHFGLGMGSRVHTLALAWASHVHTLGLAWAAVCTLWPWHGQAMCPLWALHGLILALAVQTWLRKKKKKSFSE